jgi:serine/threonine-protein phosphatase 2A regulatory subunit B''
LDPDATKQIRALVDECFDDQDGLTAPMLIPITTQVCGLSSYLTNSLYKRITGRAHDSEVIADSGTLVTQENFLRLWDSQLVRADANTRLFRILCAPGAKYLTRDDFKDLVQEIVGRHPGLEFLSATPEFQLRYAETVIARIFYAVNRAGDDQLTLRDLKKSNLLLMLTMLDNEEDINKINDFFSYEHFYVIYCKFWELDSDHDSFLDREDLLRYDDYALSPACVDRIMSGVARPLLSPEPLKLNYLDFVVFLISEVDKTSEVALEYWFRVLDLDMDDVLSTFEMDFFFCEQQARMKEAEQEDVLTMDIVCQLIDAVAPLDMTRITRADLRLTRLAPLFFDCLLNMNKFVASESRDAVRIRQMHATPQLSEWDRFAIAGYYQLADEPDDDGEGDLYEEEDFSDEEPNALMQPAIEEGEDYPEDFHHEPIDNDLSDLHM